MPCVVELLCKARSWWDTVGEGQEGVAGGGHGRWRALCVAQGGCSLGAGGWAGAPVSSCEPLDTTGASPGAAESPTGHN